MSDLINNISSLYTNTDYSSQSVTGLKNTLESTDYSNATEEELMDACKSFEAYFLEQVFKGMEKMIPDSDEDSSGSYVDMFKDTLYEEYAQSVTDRGDGIGIAKMLYEQMKRNYDL